MNLECCMCGESLGGPAGKGLCYDYGDGDHVCEPCHNVTTDLLDLLMPTSASEPGRHIANEQGCQEQREKAAKHLIRVLMRAGHKARVRVRQHEERRHREEIEREKEII
jgi:hypothetical protein